MKIPASPPKWSDNWLLDLDLSSPLSPVDERRRYLHWDKLRHLPSSGATPEQRWKRMKTARSLGYRTLPLHSAQGNPFVFFPTNELAEFQHWIDQNAAGIIGSPHPQIIPQRERERYLHNSLIEEAIHSSQMEGAATTLMQAQKMLREKRNPRNNDERMIVNNYRAMRLIGEIKTDKLTPSVVFRLHNALTEGTLPDSVKSGTLRREDNIVVCDPRDNAVLHRPPPIAELPRRLKSLCAFANGETPDYFIHPAVRAILLHFMLAYDHPFPDGNGRTARALFYWAMAKHGYWVIELVSISQMLKKRHGKYSRAFLHVETDGNDATYFLLDQIEAVRLAYGEFIKHLHQQAESMKTVEHALESALRGHQFNQRQIMLLQHAAKHPDYAYTIQGHCGAQGVSYQTARNDLLALSDAGLLRARKSGREWLFYPVDKWAEKISGGNFN